MTAHFVVEVLQLASESLHASMAPLVNWSLTQAHVKEGELFHLPSARIFFDDKDHFNEMRYIPTGRRKVADSRADCALQSPASWTSLSSFAVLVLTPFQVLCIPDGMALHGPAPLPLCCFISIVHIDAQDRIVLCVPGLY